MIQLAKLKSCVKTIYAPPLPKHIFYHTWDHNDQVEKSGLEIARGEGIEGNDLVLLRSGFYVHDVGNLLSRENHEERGVKITYELLPLFGASNKDLEVINGLIMATKTPQNPKNHLEQIMCDSDLSLMGYENWLEEIDKYRLELGIDDLANWYKMQIDFLNSHTWFTKTAANLFNEQKYNNIEKAREELKNIRS